MRRLLALLLVAVALLLPTPAFADPADFATADPPGHWFTQTDGYPAPVPLGYGVFDYPTVKFWSEFQRLGGVPVVGYPVSGEFYLEGFVVQAFQKGILQWHPESGRAQFVNVFDLLHDAGRDAQLQAMRQIPPPADTSADRGKPWPAIVTAHEALLDADAALKAAYFADPDPLDHYGLPMSAPTAVGPVVVVRCQRAALERWTVATPWAAAGQVVVANGGDIAKEFGLVPAYARGPFAPNFAFVAGGPIRKDSATMVLQPVDVPHGFLVHNSTAIQRYLPPAGPAPTASSSGSGTPPPPSPGSLLADGPQQPDPAYQAVLQHGLVNRFTVWYLNFAAPDGPGATEIISQTDAYRSADDASWDYARRVANAQAAGTQLVAIPPLGDATNAGIEHDIPRADGVHGTEYDLVFRDANVVATVAVFYTNAPGSMDLTARLGQEILQRIQAPAS